MICIKIYNDCIIIKIYMLVLNSFLFIDLLFIILQFAMIYRQNQQQLMNPQLAILIENSKQSLKPVDQFELYQNILAFMNSECKNDQAYHQLCTKLLRQIGNQRIFDALLAYILQSYRTKYLEQEKQLFSFLLNYIDSSGKYYKNAINVLYSNSINYHNNNNIQRLIDNCRSSQPRSEKVLKQINEILVKNMVRAPIINIDFTPSCFFALKCLQFCEDISNNLIQEAIRHLLIVDKIQKGQVSKLILQNEAILDKIESLGRRQYVSGFWYYLIAKIYQKQTSNFSLTEKLMKLADNTYLSILNFIDLKRNLNQQIDKIIYSDYNSQQKLSLIYRIRGITYFISNYVKIHLRSSTVKEEMIKIIEKLMQVKDFYCFQELVKIYYELINQKHVGSQFGLNIITAIQENCLPIYSESLSKLQQYDVSELNFYSFSFEGKNEIQVSPEASFAIDKIVSIMMDSRGCKHKQKICNCCQDYIHSTIQKQYDHEFNSHQFMSACHLMCREISRVISIQPEQTEIENLKNYLINNLKWLLNLNESCLPEYRKCINYKIFDLMIAFPPLYQKNQFLQEVVEDLLVSRLPQSINHLNILLKFYKQKQSKEETMSNEGIRNHLEKIWQKLLKKCGDQSLRLENKIILWDIIIRVWEQDQKKISQLMQSFTLHGDQTLAKYIVLKRKKINLAQKIQVRAFDVLQKMRNNQHFYAQEMLFIENYEKMIDL